jgi:O-antigen ligase
MLWMAMTAVAVGTILMALLFPHQGLDASTGHAGDWQGVFTSKNACGRIMVLATAVTLSQPQKLTHKVLSLALFLFVMAMSGSRGAWLIEALVLAVYTSIRFSRVVNLRNRILLLGSGTFIAAVAAAIGAMHISSLAHLLGRDATLTGRTEIWKQIWPFVMERPILGWGYAGFFRGIQGESFRVAAALRFVVFHAHNGFMEIWLELGAMGVFLFAGSYFRAWRKLWPRLRSGQIERVLWPLFVLVLIALYDLDENTLLIYNGLFWVIYVAALVNIELLAVEERLADNLAALLTDGMSAEKRSTIPA